jgi:succinoglycan biosynthesis protein ExoO
MKVSVIIPTYNAASTLRRAIDSVTSQSLRDLEIIAVDDGSSDDTFAILEELAAGDPRVRPIRLPRNGGSYAARNRAIEESRGEWIFVLDADDWYAPGRLERMVEAAERHGADMVADDQFLYDATLDRVIDRALLPFANGATERPLDTCEYLQNTITGVMRFDYGILKPGIRRAFLLEQKLRYDDAYRNGADFGFYLDILMAGGRVWLLQEAMYYYTQPVGTVSHRPSRTERLRYDYAGMRAMTDTLLARHAQRLKAEEAELLARRSRSITAYGRYLELREEMRQRQFGQAVGLSLRHPEVIPFVLRAVGRSISARMTPKRGAAA